MPQRTNEFQKLVSQIHKTIAPTGASVTDSAMVESFGQSTRREIDILLEGPLAPYAIKIAIETADDSRPFGIEDFDSYLAKYRGECRVAVDKFVIVSRSGFTRSVIEKASIADVELLTLGEAEGKDWAKLAPPQTLTLNCDPWVCNIRFEPEVPKSIKKDVCRRGQLRCPHGHKKGTPQELVKRRLQQIVLTERARIDDVYKQVRESKNGLGHLHVDSEYKGWKIQYQDKEFALNRMGFDIHVACGTAAIECKDFELSSTKQRSKRFRELSATIGRQRFSWLLTGEARQEKIVMRIDNAENRERQEKEKQKRRDARKDSKKQRRAQRRKK